MRHRNVAFALLAALITASGCGDGDLFSPGKRGNAQLTLRPSFSNGMSFAADINLIRVTVTEVGSGRVVLEKEFPVNPTDNEWDLDLDVPPNSQLEIIFLLINRTVNGQETIEFSGKLDITVTTGEQPPPPPVPLAPGGPENLDIQGISISPRPATLLEGATVDLDATPIGGPANPTIVWSSLNSTVATVDQQGNVTARAPGQATILAFAGLKTDNITINVLARAASVAIAPADPLLTSLGADVALTARVLDARGAEVPGFTVSWSVADATIATQMSPGVFRALRNGTTTITATGTGPGGVTVTGNTTLKVEQRAASITINPTAKNFSAKGETQQFTALARDASGNAVEGLAFTWISTDPAVATVDAAGLVTAVDGGTTTIRVTSGTVSAEAAVTVERTPAKITVTPSPLTLVCVGETETLIAEVKDARDNAINVPVRWFIADGHDVVSLSETGVVTARSNGTAVVIAEAGTLRAGVAVTVHQTVTGLRLNRSQVDLDGGQTFQAVAELIDGCGAVIAGRAIQWTSSNPAVATVNANGLVTGVSNGNAVITASVDGFTATIQVTVAGEGPPGGDPTGDVLIISNSSFDNTHIIQNLNSRMPGVTFAQTTSAASLTQLYLSGFKAVLLFENGIHAATTNFGNAVATYVSNGGNVVIGTFYWQGRSDNPVYGASGYGTLEGLDVFEAPPGMAAAEFSDKYEYRQATLDSESIVPHPLTQGVSSLFVSQYPNGMEAKSTTTVVARYTNGAPLIGYRIHAQGQRFVGVAVWPAHNSQAGTTGDFWQIWVNAINWARAGSTPGGIADNVVNNVVVPNSNQPGSGIGGSRGSRDPIAPAKKISQPKPR